jgi:hypothetical protein
MITIILPVTVEAVKVTTRPKALGESKLRAAAVLRENTTAQNRTGCRYDTRDGPLGFGRGSERRGGGLRVNRRHTPAISPSRRRTRRTQRT